MYPSSARLVPDDQSDERAFFARDLDEERDLSEQTVKRGHRHDAMRRPSIGTAENVKTAPEVATSSDLMQQMKLIAVDVAIVRRNLGLLAAGQEQFAAKQDQMSRNITSLQEVEQETRAQALTPPAARVIRPSPPARIVPQVPSR
jgi:hypothetical protein